ncbi:hypothetical protein D3C79_636510 [compost metagenome]
MAVDVFGHLVLFFRCRGDLRVHVANHVHRLPDLAKAVAGQANTADRLLRHFEAGVHLFSHLRSAAGQVAQQAIDFGGGVGGALGQRPHLVGNHGEASALLARTGRFDRRVQGQQVGLLGNRADGAEDRLDGVAVTLQLLDRLRRLLDLLAQAVDAMYRGIDLLLAFAGLLLATVGRLRRLAAGACHFVGSGDHFVEGGRDHVHRFALAACGFGHVAGNAGRAAGGAEDLAGGSTDVLDQAANGTEELVEPAGQLRGFVAAADFQVAGQVTLTLGNVFQAIGDAVDRAHDQFGEGRTDHREQRGQHHSDDTDQPGEPGGGLHHFALFDQADEGPAQLLVGVDVGHVVHAIEFDLDQAFAGFGQLGVTVAKASQLLEVVGGVARVDHHVAVAFHQHQVAAFAQFDLLDDFGQALERHVDVDHAAGVAQLVGHGAHGADQHRVIGGPVIGASAQGLAWVGHRQLVPGACARVVVDELLPGRPADITAVVDPVGQVGIAGVGIGQAGEELEHLLVLLAQFIRRVGAHELVQVVAGGGNHRLGSQVLDVLVDPLEEDVHRVADLADFPAAAIEESVAGFATQVEDHQGGHKDDGQAGDDRECPGQFLFDAHRRSRNF